MAVTDGQNNQSSGFYGFVRTEIQTIEMESPSISLIEGQNQQTFFSGREEFLKISPGQTAPMSTDYSPSGSPAYDYVENGVGGQVSLVPASTSAAMFIGSSFDDNLQIDGKKYFCCGGRFFLPADIAANQYVIVGAMGAIKSGVNPATLAGLKCVVLYIEGDMHLRCLIQGMSGADDVDFDTGIVLEDDTWYWGFAEGNAEGYLNLYWAKGLGEEGSPNLLYTTTGLIANDFADGTKFQPVSGIGKFSGATQPELINDAVTWMGHRATTYSFSSPLTQGSSFGSAQAGPFFRHDTIRC